MKKYYQKGTDFEIKVGTALKATSVEDLEKLAEVGLIDCREEVDLSYYEKKICRKYALQDFMLTILLENMWSIYPSSVLSLFLREIALDMDAKYEDHISNCDIVYTVSSTNGTIGSIPKSCIRSYKNFAAFRTMEDAKEACRIVKPILKELFRK